jgi:hypothetical protein
LLRQWLREAVKLAGRIHATTLPVPAAKAGGSATRQPPQRGARGIVERGTRRNAAEFPRFERLAFLCQTAQKHPTTSLRWVRAIMPGFSALSCSKPPKASELS